MPEIEKKGYSEKSEYDVQAAQGKLMTAQEYAELGGHELPYIYELKKGDKRLLYYGAKHLHEPESPQFSDIESRFDDMEPDLVIVEGIENMEINAENIKEMVLAKNKEGNIKEGGESWFAMRLAIEKGIDFVSPEPLWVEEIQHMVEQGYERQDIFGFYLFRHLRSVQRIELKNFDEKIRTYIKRFKRRTEWEDFDYSIDTINQVNQKYFRKDVNTVEPNYYREKIDPIPWFGKEKEQTVINEIARESSLYRDKKIIEKIAEYLEKYDKLMIVYGASHAVMQKPALEELLRE